MRKNKTAIVDIESYWGDALIWGKASSAGQLKYRMMSVLKEVEAWDFVSVFCARYHFKQLLYDSNIEVDYRIDLDTYLVFTRKKIDFDNYMFYKPK